jgi:two-component system sensor histidine kinase RegB
MLHTGVIGGNLRSLLYARCVAILGHSVSLLYLVSRGFNEPPGNGYLIALAALAVATLLSFYRLTAAWPVKMVECAGQLLVDVVGLTLLLYFSSGAYNPLSAYYVVIIGFAAIMLPRLYARLLALLCVLAFIALVFLHETLPMFAPPDPLAPGAQVIFGWAALTLCAGVLGWFAADMATRAREPTSPVNRLTPPAPESDQLTVLSSLAAGAADELDTPLSTMSAVVEELGELSRHEKYREDFQILVEQLDRCQTVFDKLSRTARLNDSGERRWIEVAGFVEATIRQWLRSRRDATVDISISGIDDSPRMQADYALSQAFEHILNNAADVNPLDIRVDINWDERRCIITFDDNGPGFPGDMLGISSAPVVRSGRSRMGVGLVICRATVARYGGYVELKNRSQGGARVLVHLPRQDY